MTTNHPAHGPVSLDRLHQIREHLQHDTQYSNGGNRAYILADVLKVIDGVIARELVRREHSVWSQTTFGDVGPVGPLKHLSKEALEAAAEPGDHSEWADMQFLLMDAQRRAGISDEQITQAMIEKLAVNKQREWPEPKDGEPRLHIKEQPVQITSDGSEDTKRLDWLDAQNKRLNEYYGTSYGWKFDANFQRNAMMLNDSNYPVMTVRQAIDEAIAEAPKQENF